MDSGIEQVVLGIVANGLSSVLGRIFGRAGVPKSLDAAITRSTVEYIARSGDSLDGIDGTRLAEFLESSPVRLVVEGWPR